MAETLSGTNNKFHDTLVGNVRTQAELARHLNVTKDARLQNIADRATLELCALDTDVLKENMSKRALVAANAIDILREMEKAGAR